MHYSTVLLFCPIILNKMASSGVVFPVQKQLLVRLWGQGYSSHYITLSQYDWTEK